MSSNYDMVIRDRIALINQNLINHKRKVGQGVENMHIPEQNNLVDLSNLEDITPNEDTGRKIIGKGRSGGNMGSVVNGSLKTGNGRKIGGKKGKGKVLPQSKSSDTPSQSTPTQSTPSPSTPSTPSTSQPSNPPVWNPKPEDYLSKVQLDVMDANDRRNFKLHPDWWGVYKPSKQTISPSEYLSLTKQQKDNLKINPNLVHGDIPTMSSARLDPAMMAQVYGLNETQKYQDIRDQRNFERDRDERLKEQADEDARNAPSTLDTIFGIASKVVPVVMGLGKPKKGGFLKLKEAPKLMGVGKSKKVVKNKMKGGYSDEEVQADRLARKGAVMHQKKLDDEYALSIMTPAQKAELAKMNAPLTPEQMAGGKKPKSKVVKPKKSDAKPNKWIEHVKAYANKHKINYMEALKDPKCKSSYK